MKSHSRSFKPVPFESLGAVSYSPSIVTMALSCIICEIKREWYWSKIVVFSCPPCIRRPCYGGPRQNIAILFGMGKLEWYGYPVVENFEDMCNRLGSIPACDRQTDRRTDRQTSCHGIVRAMHTRRAVKINHRSLSVCAQCITTYDICASQIAFPCSYNRWT